MNKKVIVAILIIVLCTIVISGYFVIEKINISKRKYQIESIKEYNYFVLKDEDKYGVIDKTGKTIIETKYDRIEIPNPSKDIFICFNGEKGIAVNSNSQQIFKEYNSIKAIELRNGATSVPYEKSVLKFEENGKYGLINLEGKKLLNAKYDKIEGFLNVEGELEIEQNGKIGVANINGAILVKPQYDSIAGDGYYSEDNNYQQAGFFVGQKNQDGYKYGYINCDGKLSLKLEYNDLSRITNIPAKDGVYLIIAKNGKYGVIKNKDTIIENEYQAIEYDNTKNMFIMQKGKNYGLADINGKIIIPTQNSNIEIKGEYIYVENNNAKEVYDSAGNKVNIDANVCIMPTSNDKYKIVIKSEEDRNYYGVIDSNNNQIINTEYLYIEYVFDNYFIVCNQDGKLGVLDSNANTVIEQKYDLIQKIQGKDIIQTLYRETNVTELYSKNIQKICEMENATIENQNNYIRMQSNTNLEYIDNDGKLTDSSKIFPQNNLYVAVQNGRWGYIDKNGSVKIPYEYETATELNEYGYASIKQDGKWGCIDSTGNIIVEPKIELNESFGKASFIGEYIKIDNGFGNAYYTKF